jgi:BolA protein
MSVKDRIEKRLTEALMPKSLRVVDESHLHAGHAGARPEGETHFRVYIVSPVFEGKGRIDRHRAVHEILADELAGPVHALAIHASAPGEPVREPG